MWVADAMASPHLVTLFGYGRVGTLYVVDNEIFLTRPAAGGRGLRLATLSGWVRALIQQVPAQDSRGRLREYHERFHELEFCLCCLIPYLRFLQTGREADLADVTAMRKALAEVAEQLEVAGQQLGTDQPHRLELDLIRRVLGVPCAVTNDQIIPLEKVAGGPARRDVMIKGTCYRHQLAGARPTRRVLAELQRAMTAWPGIADGSGDAATAAAKQLLAKIQAVLEGLNPVQEKAYKLLYRDQYHQLQHNRGQFVLVRGPLKNNINPGQIYVGLPISGRTRQQWLAAPPRTVKRLKDFWTNSGLPSSGGACMGTSTQYSHLFSDQFTDVEAVVQWLDAGVILASGHSVLRQLDRSRLRRLSHWVARR